MSVDGILKISDFGVSEELDKYTDADTCSKSRGSPAFQAGPLARTLTTTTTLTLALALTRSLTLTLTLTPTLTLRLSLTLTSRRRSPRERCSSRASRWTCGQPASRSTY